MDHKTKILLKKLNIIVSDEQRRVNIRDVSLVEHVPVWFFVVEIISKVTINLSMTIDRFFIERFRCECYIGKS